MSADSERAVRLGEIAGVHGVRGWVKVHSFTRPRANLTRYPDWLLETAGRQRAVRVEACRVSGRNLIAKLGGVDDRDAAFELIGAGISVRRSALPALAPGEYYWADLEGLAVVAASGERFGTVLGLIATGANDVLVLDGERLIPFVPDETVKSVDLEAGQIVVDWQTSYWE